MARQPSRALGYNVMERVRETAAPAPPRYVWVSAAAGLALCAGLAALLVTRAPSGVVLLPRSLSLPIAQAAVVPEVPNMTPAAVRPARRVAPRVARPPTDASPIAPIETQQILLAAIDVPQLEAETTWVDPITIEPLIIEPLGASND